MSFFGDFKFFIYLFIALIPAIILGIKEKKIKYYSIMLTIFFIAIIVGNDIKQLMYLLLYAFVELHIIKIYMLLRRKYGKNRAIYMHAIIFSVIPLILCKISTKIGLSIFGFVGISYLTFKTVQIIIETYDGLIDKLDTVDFLEFLFFFPTLSSGPIDRSRRFIDNMNKTYTWNI